MLWKCNINIFNRSLGAILRYGKKKDVLHYGVGNRCKDGQYVVFLDYDETYRAWIEDEIRLLQERFVMLGNAYLFKTKNGFHVIFLEKVTMTELLIILDTTTCDKNYRTVPMLYARRIWVLRQSTKKGEAIEYLGRIKKRGCRNERSRAHAMYLEEFCGVKEIDIVSNDWDYGPFDDEEIVIMGYYHIAEENN